ncbi:hypothetical protein [Rhizobium tropici]|uniref:Uncharacterized protein n=1 Tax=Rhizobium tropici TaxID=398 RepID=A0A329YFX4_RHITR|nr:hypothetical protein [Rhizobium tropici]RAX42427.1 hypothetical protein DQ393_06185 [Rhizobium tropici]
MAFQLIVPPPKASKGAFRIATVQRGAHPFSLQISMPAAMFHLQYGDHESFDILIGEGPDKGKLLIRPAENGHFKPTRLKYTCVFRLPVTEWTPQIALSTDNPERRQTAEGALLVTLPDWVANWKDIQKAREQVSRERQLEKLQGK